MKRIFAVAILAIGSFALAGQSQAQSTGVKATVPFDFTVSNKLLPAGTYTIKPQRDSKVIVIQNDTKPIAVLSLTEPSGKRSPHGGRLLFHRYGAQYFLTEIICDDAEMNMSVPTSRTEKRVQLMQARLQTATETLVAAR